MMAISINNRLTNFAQQELVLAHNETERDKIKSSLSHLEKILGDKLGGCIDEFVRFGSFTRNTILPRKYDSLSDVDLMIAFDISKQKYSPGTYRKWLIDTLTQAYPNSISKKDFPAVKLELNHIMFDVVPAYSEELLWNKYYYIPGAADTWKSTVPNDINQTLSDKNQSYGNNVVRNVIRLCKHWNAGAGYCFDSYEMEKWILNRIFFYGDNLYDKFLSVLDDMASNQAGVRQALDWIRKYKGTLSRPVDDQKQLEWLQKLLPGLT
jgi:hypothetical protein